MDALEPLYLNDSGIDEDQENKLSSSRLICSTSKDSIEPSKADAAKIVESAQVSQGGGTGESMSKLDNT